MDDAADARHLGYRAVRTRLFTLVVFGGLLLAIDTGSVAGQVVPSVSCEKCHDNPSFLAGLVPRNDALRVSDSLLQDGAHSTLRCLDCHTGAGEGYPHRSTGTLSCGMCHETESADWNASIHAVDEAAADAPTCIGCHGSAHTVYRSSDRKAPTHALNVAATCGRCHNDPEIIGTYFMAPEGAQARVAVRDYYQTVHGAALTRSGLTLSATCNDCHESHRVLPADSSESSVNRQHIAGTCGSCHVGILEVYEAGSAHGAAYRAGRRSPEGLDAPACIDCHSAHQVVRAAETEWFVGSSYKCGACHQELWDSYLETYHGQVTRLGFGLTAKCSDCHTPHNMRPASDLQSSVHPINLIETCSRCHPKANARFVQYYAHGNPRDRRGFPLLYWPWLFMTTLLIGVWSFFGLHSLLWFSGLAFEKRKQARQRKGTPPPRS